MRKSVKELALAMVRDGEAKLLKIEYQDGRQTYGVSEPGCGTLFGTDFARALWYFNKITNWSNRKI